MSAAEMMPAGDVETHSDLYFAIEVARNHSKSLRWQDGHWHVRTHGGTWVKQCDDVIAVAAAIQTVRQMYAEIRARVDELPEHAMSRADQALRRECAVTGRYQSEKRLRRIARLARSVPEMRAPMGES